MQPTTNTSKEPTMSSFMEHDYDDDGAWVETRIDPGYVVLDREFTSYGNEIRLWDYELRELRQELDRLGIWNTVEWVGDEDSGDDWFVLVRTEDRDRAAAQLRPYDYQSRMAGKPDESEADARARALRILDSEQYGPIAGN